jgi:hypothetical protein
MNRKGVCYDVGIYMAFNWRPHFDGDQVHRELQIIKDDLHCNAVKITGTDLGRLSLAARHAVGCGLEAWFCPTIIDRSPEETLRYLGLAAKAAEEVRGRGKDSVVFMAGGESTLFMRGILDGKNFMARLANPNLFASVKAGEHNKPLNEFLAKANQTVRSVYRGRVTYASLVWEAVNWDYFDFVGVDAYRTTKMGERYLEMLAPSFKHGKPVVVTESGHTTIAGAGEEGMLKSAAGLEAGIINEKSRFIHYRLPVVGRLVRPHLNGSHVRDEEWQASMLVETLQTLDNAGVDDVFVSGFLEQTKPYSDDPRYDLDMASFSLVKYYEGGRRGTTYPDMPWEPKESFRAVAEYYSNH